MKLTCPACHTIFHLESAMEEAAGREFTAFVCGLGELARPLVAYLGLFRPPSRALAYDRMLRLAREAVELTPDSMRLAAALSETVEALRQKRDAGTVQPLKNHNYLKRVLENTCPGPPAITAATSAAEAGFNPTLRKGGGEAGGISKTARAMTMLEEWAGGDWLRQGIAAGLAACLAQNLRSQPASEIITRTADTWRLALNSRLTIEEIDRPRLVRAFELLLPTLEEWPVPRRLVDLLPERPQRRKLPLPEISEEQRGENLERLNQLLEKWS